MVAEFDVVQIVTTVVFAVGSFWLMRKQVQQSVSSGIRSFLVLLGGIVAFSGGGSQVGLATGPLESLFTTRLDAPNR